MSRFPCYAIGLMSGTSLDGIDAALMETDSESYVQTGISLTVPYTAERRSDIRSLLHPPNASHEVCRIAHDITDDHVHAVHLLLDQAGLSPRDISALGFHGQTILHRPAQQITCQIGDGQRLADQTGIPVVHDFRAADVKAGGQGAPLVPVYHRARLLAHRGIIQEEAHVVLNIGGVANITFVAAHHPLLACDVGPGNALIDDWMLLRTGHTMDVGESMPAADLSTPPAFSGPYLILGLISLLPNRWTGTILSVSSMIWQRAPQKTVLRR